VCVYVVHCIGRHCSAFLYSELHTCTAGISPMLYFIISVFPFHVVLAVNLSLKQTALVLSNYSQNMLP